jgi:CheY-like chemotaxis protein
MSPRVLVVESDAPLRARLRKVLDKAGYDVLVTTTYQEGRRAFASETFDLVVTNLRLGEFNGLQLLIFSPHPVPAIVITAFHDSLLAEEAKALGAAYLTVPFKPAEFLRAVREKLSGASTPVEFAQSRRWIRKNVGVGTIPVRIQDFPARILDISYGGVRLEVPRVSSEELPPSFAVTLPSADVSVNVDLVWKAPAGDDAWMCGAVLADANSAATRAWCGVVDAIA